MNMEKTNYFSELILTKPCDAEQHVKLLVPFYYLGLQEKRGKKKSTYIMDYILLQAFSDLLYYDLAVT